MLSNETANQINELIQINIDSSAGYAFAGSNVSDGDLQRIFNINSKTRETFAKELQNAMKAHNENPEDDGSIKGSLHRIWMTFKADLITNNELTIVDECIRGDEEALELYNAVSPPAIMPQTIRLLVTKQHKEINETLGQLKEWKRIFESKKLNA